MRATLLQNWSFGRVLRLVIALVFLAAGVAKGDTIAYVAAAFFGFQAVLNRGCFGMPCAPAASGPGVEADTTEVSYEEVR